MKQNSENEIVARGAAAWKEREEHELVMKLLDGVRGFVSSYVYINGNCYYWATTPLDEKKALEIMHRGRHDEILYMIHQYGKAQCPGDQRPHLHHVHDCILSDEVQELIVLRNNREEIDAYTSYYGFGEKGQDAILDRENHEEIMRYISRHGFKSNQQRRLKARGNVEEINLHISKHGWAYELLDELFEKLENSGALTEYYEFITRHEFPVPYQKRMLRVVKTPEYRAYVDRYGLWYEAHGDLVECRTEREVQYYIEKHRYLCLGGETVLAQKGSGDLKKFYIDHRVETQYDRIDRFVFQLLKVRPLDYEFLTMCFLLPSFSNSPHWEDEETFQIMQNGSHEEVMKCIEGSMLGNKALVALFFRNNKEEFEAYLDRWINRY